MPRKRRVSVILTLTLITLLAIPLATNLTVSHYRRWQASRLLATLRTFTPGTTTENQARAALQPFSPVAEDSGEASEGVNYHRVEYQFYNMTDWTTHVAYHLTPYHIRLSLPWTLVSFNVDYQSGFVSRFDVSEAQEDQPGFPHPNSASTSVVSSRFSLPSSPFGPPPAEFTGYSTHSQSTGGIDQTGNSTGFICCHARHIVLDEHATATQRRDSLNFQLHCLTSYIRCKDDHQILP